MEGSTHPQSDPLEHGTGYETQDANVKGVAIFVLILVTMVVLVHIAVQLALNALQARSARQDRQVLEQEVIPAVAGSRTFFPLPREQISPKRDLATLRAEEDAQLNSYGWVDRKSGVVRMPIQRAMELIGQKGAPPTWTTNANKGPSSLQLQQQRPIQSTPPAKEEGKQ